jgi:hypothetical protein
MARKGEALRTKLQEMLGSDGVLIVPTHPTHAPLLTHPTPAPLPTHPAHAPLPTQLRVDSYSYVNMVKWVVSRDGNFVVASSGGTLLGLEAETGRQLWTANAGSTLSAGVGSDGRFHAVVTTDNKLVTFEGSKELWREQLKSRVSTAPLVAGERVFVMGVDRAVHAYDAKDGKRLCRYVSKVEDIVKNQVEDTLPEDAYPWIRQPPAKGSGGAGAGPGARR